MKSTQKLGHGSFNRKLFIALMTCTMLSATTSTSVMAQDNTDDDSNFILYDSSNDFTEDFIFKFGDEVFVAEEPEDDPDPDPTPSTSSYDIAYDISTWTHYLTAGSFNPIDLGQATPVETITIVGSPSLPLTCEFLTPAVDIPDGIILNGTTCELTGNPTEFGTWNVSIALRDSVGTASTPALMEIVALPDPTPPPEPSSYDISYDISTWTHYLSDDGLTAYDHGQPTPVETITIVGSPSLPLSCEFLTPAVDVPDGITLDGATCELSGHPTEFGTWNVSIALRNSVGTASTPALMEIVASASGDVQLISGGDSDTLRILEPFEADPIQVSGAIGDVTFAPSRSVIADGVNVSLVDGAIDPGSYINTADSNYEFTIDATDEAGRTFETPPTYSYNVVDSFIFTNNAANNSVSEVIGTEETSKSVTVDFSGATFTNQMGSEIRYEIRGNYPGIVYTGYYDPDFYGPGSGENVFSYDNNGTPVVSTETPADGNIILYPDVGYLEIYMTQAQTGTHSFELVAIDNHIDSYTNPTESQIAPNEDAEVITLSLSQSEVENFNFSLVGKRAYYEIFDTFSTFVLVWDDSFHQNNISDVRFELSGDVPPNSSLLYIDEDTGFSYSNSDHGLSNYEIYFDFYLEPDDVRNYIFNITAVDTHLDSIVNPTEAEISALTSSMVIRAQEKCWIEDAYYPITGIIVETWHYQIINSTASDSFCFSISEDEFYNYE